MVLYGVGEDAKALFGAVQVSVVPGKTCSLAYFLSNHL